MKGHGLTFWVMKEILTTFKNLDVLPHIERDADQFEEPDVTPG